MRLIVALGCKGNFVTDESNSKFEALQEEVSRLREENARLNAELALSKAGRSASQRVINWIINAWLGSDMRKAGANLAEKSQEWSEGKANTPVRETVEFLTASIVRFTRIGIFRISVAIIITAATLWFAAAQVVLLNNQNQIIQIQKQVEAADRFALFAEREQSSLRALGTAYDLHYELKDLALEASDPPVSHEELRRAVLLATPSEEVTTRIVTTCGIHKYPVGNPSKLGHEIIKLIDQGDVSAAKWKTADLRRWLNRAADACHKETEANRKLRKNMENEMSISTEPETRND